MKYILILLTTLSCFAQPWSDVTLSQPVVAAAGGGGGNITAILWQTFEGGLNPTALAANDNFSGGTWTTNSAAGASVGSDGQKAPWFTINSTTDTGSQGLRYDNNTGGGNINFEPPTYPTTTNVFFMFRCTALADSTTASVFAWGETATADNICHFRIGRSGATYTASLQAGNTGSASGDITISINTWYGVAIQIVRNGTCRLRFYSDSGSQVGSEVTVTGQDKNLYYHFIPGVTASGVGERQIDNYCFGATHPLIP